MLCALSSACRSTACAAPNAVCAYGALLRPDGSLAQPDPDRPETLERLVVHHGSRKGAWPSSPEIGSVMLRERR